MIAQPQNHETAQALSGRRVRFTLLSTGKPAIGTLIRFAAAEPSVVVRVDEEFGGHLEGFFPEEVSFLEEPATRPVWNAALQETGQIYGLLFARVVGFSENGEQEQELTLYYGIPEAEVESCRIHLNQRLRLAEWVATITLVDGPVQDAAWRVISMASQLQDDLEETVYFAASTVRRAKEEVRACLERARAGQPCTLAKSLARWQPTFNQAMDLLERLQTVKA